MLNKVLKRWGILLAVFSILLQTIPVYAYSDSDIQNKMDTYYSVVSNYGTPHWNGNLNESELKKAIQQQDYITGLTQSACKYTVKHLREYGCTSNIFGGGAQCHGFAKYLCYIIYGSYPIYAYSDEVGNYYLNDREWNYYSAENDNNYPGLQPGDLIRYYYDTDGNGSTNKHTAIVYSVDSNGITVIDNNRASDSCGIKKGYLWASKTKKITESDFKSYYNDGKAYICRHKDEVTIQVDVNTESSQNITQNSAILYGSVVASGSKVTEVGMYIGTTKSSMSKLGSDSTNSYSPNMWYSTSKYGEILQPNTTYYYRAYAVVGGKTYEGDIKSFTTLSEVSPTILASKKKKKNIMTMQDDVCGFLSATTIPSEQKVTWKSSNNKVATVNSQGVVAGVKEGTATITASITYEGETYFATCKVYIVNSEEKATINEKDNIPADKNYFKGFVYSQSISVYDSPDVDNRSVLFKLDIGDSIVIYPDTVRESHSWKWVLIESNGRKGYANLSLLAKVEEITKENTQYNYVLTGNKNIPYNIRSNPLTGYDVVGVLHGGDKVIINTEEPVYKQTSWTSSYDTIESILYCVESNGVNGYISDNYLKKLK